MQLLTIVFTDVVESSATKRDISLGRDNRERDRAYLENIQARHFQLIRATYGTHGGKEVSTMGDAFYLTFEDPVEAVRCAVDIQKHLAAGPIETPRGPLRLRIGIHSGYPEFFEGGWHGTDVDTAARVEAAATERQILLSSRTYELVCHMSDVKFHSRGVFALKGVERMSLYEADWDGKGLRPTVFQPLAKQLRRKWTRLAIASSVAVVLAVAVLNYRTYVERKTREAAGLPGSVNVRRSVAVLGFKNLGKPDANPLSVALSEMLSTELGAGEQLRTIPGEEVARAKADLSLPDAPTYAADTLARIRKRLAADDVIVGSYMEQDEAEGGKIRLDLRAQDTNTGDTVCTVSEAGTRGKLFELVSQVGAELRRHLGVAAVTPTQEANVRASFPSDPDAARSYADGLAKLRLFDAVGARDLLEKTVDAAPDFALGHSALAEAWSSLGYDDKAKEEAKKALDLSSALAREDQMVIEGRYHEFNSEWEKATATYSSLSEYFKDNPEYRLKLVSAQTSAGKSQDALVTVEQLRRFPAPQKDDPRIDLAEAEAVGSLSDYKREVVLDERAVKNAQAQDARFLAAQGLMDQCGGMYKLGDLQKAKHACEDAKTTFAMAGDRKDSARTLTRLANVLRDQGDGDAALRLHKEALQNMREIGSQRDIAGALVNIAMLLSDRGDLDAAEKNYQEALNISREGSDLTEELVHENDLASVSYAKGDFTKAKTMYEQVADTAQKIGDKESMAVGLSNVGMMLSLQGDLGEAQKKIRAALVIERELGTKSDIASSLDALGDIRMAQDDLTGARMNYEESLKIRKQTGEKGALATSSLALASLALEQDIVPQAESLAREGEKTFEGEKDVANEASGREVLARALIAQDKLSEAESVMQAATKLPVQDRTVLLSLRITAARLGARTGKSVEALHNLDGVINEAKSMKLLGHEFEARLAKVEIELQISNSQVARAALKVLQQQANQKTYRLIERKAAQLGKRTAALPSHEAGFLTIQARRQAVFTSVEQTNLLQPF
jgi:eukaryotic-like serine/threonine-protein kinase